METLKCEFPDGKRREVPLEDVATHIGQGAWGREYLKGLAEYRDTVFGAVESSACPGKVILLSWQKSERR